MTELDLHHDGTSLILRLLEEKATTWQIRLPSNSLTDAWPL